MNIQEHNKCCIKCNDAGNCVYKDCFCHEGDSAMSGELTEKWEDDFINKYESFQFSESVAAPEMQRYLSYIRQQRSLAQQEILDRMEDYRKERIKVMGDAMHLECRDGKCEPCEYCWSYITKRHELERLGQELLSTLKDTNI